MSLRIIGRLLAPLFLICSVVALAQDRLPLIGAGAPSGGFSPSCSQSSAFLARTSGLDLTHETAYDTMICGLVTDGVWSSLDGFYVYATKDSTTAGLNLVGTSYSPVTVTGSPTFTADRGYTPSLGNGITISINLATTPNFTQNAASVGAWSLSSAQDGSDVMAGDSGSPDNIYPRYTDDNAYLRINDSAGGMPNVNGTGFYLGVRTSATGRTGYKNGVSLGSYGSVTSSAPTAVTVGCPNPMSGTTTQAAACIIGGNIDSVQLNLYNRLRAYMTAVGVP
jgi:hypothetical protein